MGELSKTSKPLKAAGVFLVTGARSGIGRSICEALLQAGYHVLGVSRTIEKDSIDHPDFTAKNIDLARLDFLKDAANKLRQQLVAISEKNEISLSGVVFCAGKGSFGNLEQLSDSTITQQVDLNLTSQILLTGQLISSFKKQKSGLLIYLGSEAALKGGREGSVYCATKFGLRGFVQALNEECSASGVCATLINPSMVSTPFFDELHFTPGQDKANAIEPETIANLVVHLATMPPETVVDEITLSPRKRVVQKK